MHTPKMQSNTAYFVGQKGDFQLLDSFMNPIETVTGEIIQLMAKDEPSPTYAMILTNRGIRPARLA